MRSGVGIKAERVQYTIFIPLLFVAALIAYKWNASGIAIQKVSATGVMLARPDVVAFGGYTTAAALERTLFAVAKMTNWKIAATLAGLIWAVAVLGGLIVNQFPV